MDDTMILVARLEEQIKTANERIDDLEKQAETTNKLALSVERMAVTMQNMVDTMKNHNARLEAIEKKPAEAWNSMQKTIFTSVTSTLAGGILGALLSFLL